MKNILLNKWDNHWSKLSQRQDETLNLTSLNSFGMDCYTIIKQNMPKHAKNVLEIGCGTGRFSMALANNFPNITFEGSDLSEHSLRIANDGVKLRKLPNLSFYKDDILKIHPHQKKYDYIFLEGLLHYLPQKLEKKILIDLTNLLNNQGILLIGVPNKRFYLHTIHNFIFYPLEFWNRCFERSYFAEQLEKSFQKIGLTKIYCEATAMNHGFLRAGFPWKILTEKWLKKYIPSWNKKYGFYLFIKGEKP